MKRLAMLVLCVLLLTGCEVQYSNVDDASAAATTTPLPASASANLPDTSPPDDSKLQVAASPAPGTPLTAEDLCINGVYLGDTADAAIEAFSFAPYNTRVNTSPVLSFDRYYRVSGDARNASVTCDADGRVRYISNNESGMTTSRGIAFDTTLDDVIAQYGEPEKTVFWARSESDGQDGDTVKFLFYECPEGVLAFSFSYREPSVVTNMSVYRKHEYKLLSQWTRMMRLTESDDGIKESVVRVYLPEYDDWSLQYSFEPAVLSIEQDEREILRGQIFQGYEGFPGDLRLMEAPMTMDFNDDGEIELGIYCQGYVSAYRTEDLTEIDTVHVWQLIADHAGDIFGEALTQERSYTYISARLDSPSPQSVLLCDLALYDGNAYPNYPMGPPEAIIGFATVSIALREGRWDVVEHRYYPSARY